MSPDPLHTAISRRHFLSRTGTGIGAAALASLLNPRLLGAVAAPHFAPKARRIIWLTQAGAPSQLDLFDYKPNLAERFDQDLPESVRDGRAAAVSNRAVGVQITAARKIRVVAERIATPHGEVRR